MKQITTLLVAAGMTLAAFAQTPSTVGVALQPRTSRVVGTGTNLFMANADRAVATVDTVARLATLTNAVHGSVVDVRGYASEFDWPVALRYTLNTNSAASTNRFVVVNAGGVGRWVHEWRGDVRSLGAKGDGVTDDTDAILDAAELAQSTKVNGNSVLYFPGGIYRLSQTLSITNQRVKIHGDVAFGSAFNNSKILFTGTNQPILSVSGFKCQVSDLALEYETMQWIEATNSICLRVAGSYVGTFERLALRKGAYGLGDGLSLGGNVENINNSFRDIWVQSFSRGGIRFDRLGTSSEFNNIYVQNAADGIETSVVNVTSVSKSGTNLNLTLDQLPTRIRTNMFIRIAGLEPSGLNGLNIVTNISGTTVSVALASDPGAVTDSVGTLEVTARYCHETPVDIGYGWMNMGTVDIEHAVINGGWAMGLRGEYNQVADVHFEQIHPINGDFTLFDNLSGSGANIGSLSFINSGFVGGTTNYVARAGFQSARTEDGTPISIGFLRVRDIARSGTTWLPLKKMVSTYPDIILLNGYDLLGHNRVYGNAQFTDENFGMSFPARYKFGRFSESSGSATMQTFRPRIEQSGSAVWTGIWVQPTNSTLSFGSGGGYPFRYSASGFDRFLVQENGRMVITAGSSNATGLVTQFQGHDQVHPSGRVNILYGQTNVPQRMNIGPNYLYVADNLGVNQGMALQVLGSWVSVGNGTSGSGLRVGGTGVSLIQNIASTTAAWDPPSLANGESAQYLSSGISVVGSTDVLLASLSSVGTNQFTITAVPTGSSNQVAVTLMNCSGSTVDLGSGTLRLVAMDF